MIFQKGQIAPNKGKRMSEEQKRKLSEARKGKKYGPFSEQAKRNIARGKLGEKNPMWKGNNVGYLSLHEWVRKYLPEPNFCQICNIKPPHDLANISGEYLRDLTDWQYLCRRCHMDSDGRIYNLRNQGVKN